MSLSLEEVEEHARRLSPEDRARLAEILLESVREVPEPDIEAEWEREIEARVDAFERGETQTFAAEDVLAEARQQDQTEDHSGIPDPPGFSDLSKTEQIRYLQDLCDRISDQPEDLPVLESHLVLAEERLADYRRDPSGARSAYEIIDELVRRDG